MPKGIYRRTRAQREAQKIAMHEIGVRMRADREYEIAFRRFYKREEEAMYGVDYGGENEIDETIFCRLSVSSIQSLSR